MTIVKRSSKKRIEPSKKQEKSEKKQSPFPKHFENLWTVHMKSPEYLCRDARIFGKLLKKRIFLFRKIKEINKNCKTLIFWEHKTRKSKDCSEILTESHLTFSKIMISDEF